MNDWSDDVAAFQGQRPAAPASPDGGWSDEVAQIQQARRSQAAAVNVVAQMGDADKAARAAQIAGQLGVPPALVQQDLPGYEQQLAIKKAGGVIAQSPGLVNWLVANPESAVMAKDDMDRLGLLDRIASGARAGWEEGWDPTGTPRQRPSGLAAGTAHMAASVAGMMTEAYGSSEAAAGAAGGAAIGMMGGPALPVSAPAAGFIGWQAGAISHVINSRWKPALDTAAQIRDAEGNPLNPAAQVGLAAVNTAIQGAMTALGGGAVARETGDALLRAVLERPTTMDALARYGAGLGKSAAHGGAIGAGAAGVEAGAEQIARGITNALDGTDFSTVAEDPEQRERVLGQVVTEGLKWAAFGGALHGTIGTLGLARDLRRVQASDRAVETISGLLDASADSTLRQRSPDAFKTFLQQQVEGGPVENLEIPGEAILAQYHKMGVDPYRPDDPIAAAIPGWHDQLREAEAIGGTVKISTADYAAHLAGTDLDAALRRDIAPEGGYSIRDRDTAIADIKARYEDQLAALEKEIAADNAAASPREAVYRDMRTRLMAEAGMSATQADTNAKLWAAHYSARAEDWNAAAGGEATDAWDQYQRQTVGLQRPLPADLRRYPVDVLDGLLNELRDGAATGSQGEMFGPHLTDWLASHGGLAPDAGGELAARGLDRWHIGKPGKQKLLRQGGRSLEDAATAAAENGFLPEVKRALDAGEKIDLEKALLEALDRDREGDGVRSELLGHSEAADRARALQELQRALDEEGIDLKRETDNVAVKQALERRWKTEAEGRKGRAFGQPVNAGVDPERMVSVVDISHLLGSPRDSESLIAAMRMLVGQPLNTGDQGRVARMLPKHVRHVVYSGAPIHPQDKAVRSGALHTLADLLAQAPLIESGANTKPDKKPNVDSYHRFYVPIWDGKKVRVLRIVAEQSKAGVAIDPNQFDVYDVVTESKRLSPGRSVPNGGTASTPLQVAGQPQAVTIRQMLSGVKDMGGKIYFQSSGAPAERGSIQFFQTPGERIDAIINLFKADSSTFAHESAHLWLEELIRDGLDPEAPQAFRDDLAATLAWMGVERPEDIGVEQHEKFARAFEAYLMEGKAPSIELEGVFARFKGWLTRIYRTLTGLEQTAGQSLDLSPEIRAVFDRMVASEDEVKLAREQQGMRALFKSPEDAGMTPEQFEAYTRAVQAAQDAAVTAVERKAIAALARERTAEWTEQAEKVRAEVTQAIDARPDIRAWEAIRKGKITGPDGDERALPKLDRGAIVAMFGGSGILKDLKVAFGPIYGDKGIHPDVMAELFGLRDGHDLIETLVNLKRQQGELRREAGNRSLSLRTGLIEHETLARMRERHGDPLTDGSLVAEALDAVHNEKQQAVLLAEMKVLRRLARQAGRKEGRDSLRPALADAKATARWLDAERNTAAAKTRDALAVSREAAAAMLGAARDQIARAKSRDLSLSTYTRAEAKAAREAEKAALKHDYEAAADAKQRQALAHALWRAARDAQEQVEKDQSLLGRFAGKATIKGLAQDYLDQIHALLERFDFRPASRRTVERRQSLAAWIMAQEAAGAEVMISDKLRNDAFRQHYSDMTVSELHDLADAVRNIAHLGRLKDKLLSKQVARDLQEAKDWLTNTAFRHPQRQTGPEMVKGSRGGIGGWAERFGGKARAINAPLMKIEQLCLMLDGGDSQGAWNTLLFRRAKDALALRYEFENRVVKAFRDLKDLLPADWAKGLGPHDFLAERGPMLEPDSGQPARFRRKDLLAMMLNMGNDGNFNRLTEGFGGARNGWTRENVKAFVDRHATADDWRFVQGVWDTFESFRGEIGALQKRLSGVEPEWVEAVPVETPHGTFRGGYFPVLYDLTRSPRAEELNEKASAQTLFGGLYVRATTPKGHTKARAESYSAPLDLNAMDLIGARLGQHIHDLAFREAVIDINRLISDPAVKRSIGDAIGPEYVREFRQWLADMASDRNIDPRAQTGLDRFLRQARLNMTAVGIAWRFTTFAKHGMGAAFNSIGELGPKWMLVGLKDLYGNPTRTAAMVEEIKAKSSEMRYRKEQYDRDVMANFQDLAQHVGLTGDGIGNGIVRMRDWWNHAGHWLVSEGDWLSALPTWRGAYRKAQIEGMSEADAVYAADQAVRRAHGSQSLIDRAGIQRKSELWNCMTMFYGFFNHIWNRQVDMVDRAHWGIEAARMGDWKSASHEFAAVGWRAMFYILVPALIEAAVIEGLPDEDEGWWGWTGRAVAGELMAGVPILRDVGKYALGAFGEAHYGLSVTPLQSGAETLVKTAVDMSALFDDDKAMSDTFLKKAVTSAGILSGFGLGAPAGYSQYIFDVLSDREHPDDVAEFTRTLLLGKRKEH